MSEMITVQVDVKKDIETVWNSWIDPEHIVNWYFASEVWHCPSATNNFTQSGAFCYKMAAKDGSMEFDFDGSYKKIIENEMIEFNLNDGRKVKVSFRQLENGVQVVESFDPDDQVSLDMQKVGWQAILDNFRNYSESL